MHTPEQLGDVLDKRGKCIAREKAMLINAFLNEYGEHATWEEWLEYLHTQHQLKRFEWIFFVD